MVTKKNKTALAAAALWGEVKNRARERHELFHCKQSMRSGGGFAVTRNVTVEAAKKRIEEIEKTTATKDLMIATDIVELENTIRVTERDLEDVLEASLTRDLILLFVIAAAGFACILTLSA